ncbi:hypothetical protein HDEF_0229 [Candidatus Hamiltonella defensa 5AT (Acyrthosiphon pisum)]|uniref:Uncharacterized protein n=1 Tax=Hamiltonella defensa subsp. Acyrthosiphon pisum (strain 5AT) TaxID=572265 RepID=C4K355_HAMD5|nr:hypothetical protein HDEF_0229 [Candidatus Hamiltonella defensa 5AT (Acyrthosiphon pisum)]
MRTATFSGETIAIRFGARSANKIKRLVINEKEQIKLNVSAHSDLIKSMKMLFMKGEKAASPKIPPRMATAFRPIWTTVKKTPGVSCNFKTRKALLSPSSAMTFNFILREAAREISDKEKKALIAIKNIMINRLLNIMDLFSKNRMNR